ncbi:MAG: efflux transporter outer membrane subunit [Planctomycetes bacterium]|nr:efflux transporter outer membrane subunit [Planctomycetota bacterium]
MAVVVVVAVSGCASLRRWWHNGWKVGPEYCPPEAPVAETWLDRNAPSLRTAEPDLWQWWTQLGDPVLDQLVQRVREQNIPLQIAAWRIAEARALRGIAAGNLFPQKQQALAAYSRNRASENAYPFNIFLDAFPFPLYYNNWIAGFDMAWELDLWGKVRRGIEAADASWQASIVDYNALLVSMQAEVAAAYVQLRTLQERLALARKHVELQQETLRLARDRFAAGVVSEIDVRQASAELAVLESAIPTLEEARRKVENALCFLLGSPPGSLRELLEQPAPPPTPPPELVVGIPADLLRRRPDVQKAEWLARAQCARIGVAEADFYPQLAITGAISVQAEEFANLFDGIHGVAGSIGPAFQWKILHYGRLKNAVRAQEARLQQALYNYQNAVLAANREAEDAIVAYLREQQRMRSLQQAVHEAERALQLGLKLYQAGVIDYQRVLDALRAVVAQQDALADSRGKVVLNLIAVYKALGGGWENAHSEESVPESSPSQESERLWPEPVAPQTETEPAPAPVPLARAKAS